MTNPLNIVSVASTVTAESMTLLQERVQNKIKKTVNSIAKQVFTTIISLSNTKGNEFLGIQMISKEETLPNLDQRACIFFQKMMESVNITLAAPDIQKELLFLGIVMRNAQVDKKLVETIAVSHVKTLLDEFDAENKSIVDEINK